MFNDKEYRIGAFSGVVAGILVLALTAMAFSALQPRERTHAMNWEISPPEAPPPVTPSFGS
ncbi:MAG: hypothetical protein ACT4OF_03045 [Caulobacteraceae bacterium]